MNPEYAVDAVPQVEYQITATAEDYIEQFCAQGKQLLETAHRRDLDQAVPFCPNWSLRDLITHIGWVYRWVSVIVGENRKTPPSGVEREKLQDPDPSDDLAIVARLESALDGILTTLREAPPQLTSWTTWETQDARRFWARRMLHETVIHRVDVQNVGSETTVLGSELGSSVSADGIDEMVCGFASRYAKTLRTTNPAVLELDAVDAGHRWWVELGPNPPRFGRGAYRGATSATSVSGRSGELLLFLWNRRSAEGLDIRGHSHVLDTWVREAHL
jgi:uncharacterized protein (TIGR03083 family)